jgi:arginine/ornithine transport system substrate-binding protein
VRNRLGFLFALAVICGHATVVQAQTTVRIATEGAYPPFNYVDAQGKLGGFDIDIANAICTVSKFNCTIVAQNWDGIIPGLNAEKYDLIIAAMTATAERAKVVAFSNKYASMPFRFVASNRVADAIAAAPGAGIDQLKTALRGKTIGLVAASTADPYVRNKFDGLATLRSYQKMSDALLDLKAGRIDAYADGALGIDATFLKTDAGKGYRFAGAQLKDPAYFGTGVGVAVRLKDTELLAKVNAALAQILTDGTYQKIAKKHFDFDIYGD